jgi:hypothetical protein
MLRHIAHWKLCDTILKIEIPMPVLLLEKKDELTVLELIVTPKWPILNRVTRHISDIKFDL